VGDRVRDPRSRSRCQPDAATWTTIYSTTTGTGGTQTLAVSGSGRYIRMYGTTRGDRVRVFALGVQRQHDRRRSDADPNAYPDSDSDSDRR